MNKEKIGAKLKELRGKKSIRAVAKDLNLAPSTITMYENGDRIPKDDIKISIAKYYGQTVESIFYDAFDHV